MAKKVEGYIKLQIPAGKDVYKRQESQCTDSAALLHGCVYGICIMVQDPWKTGMV